MSRIYDTFLCQEPARQDPFFVVSDPDDSETLLKTYEKSVAYFAQQNRVRAVERLQYEIALLHLKHQQWRRALKILVPLWQTISWRQTGWWQLLEGVDWALRECAQATSDVETLIAVEWELLSNRFSARTEWHYDFSKCLDGILDIDTRPKITIRAERVVGCLSATLAFDAIEGHVGVPLPAQLLLTSQAQNQSTPLVVSNVFIEFEGGLKPIDIRHDVIEFSNMSASANTEVHNVSLEKSSTVIDPSISLRSASSTIPSDHFLGSSDLSLKPGVSKALSFLMHPYDAGTSSVKAIAVTIQNDSFDANIVFSAKETRRQEFILHQGTSGLLRRRVRGNRHDSIAILPKPPKLQIQIPMLLKEYLTDESIILDIILTNKEEDHVKVELEVGFSGERGMLPGLRFVPLSEDAHALELADREDHPRFTYSLDQMNPLESRTARIAFKASSIPLEMVLEIKALYYLISEPDTPMSKIYTNQMVFDRPFEANYEFRPLIDTAMWPNYFQLDESCVKIGDSYGHNTEARGLRQKWYSVARIASFAGQPLDLESVNLQVMNIRDDVACTVETVTSCSSETVTIKPNGFHETYFEITAQKLDLDDREAAFLRLQLEVRWQRHGAHATAVTQIAAPNLVLPFGEPRVLASAGRVQGDAKVIPLDYTIENPSDHVLTFDLSMEASEEFAFSGCKARALQLVPLSRHTIRFNIMPLIHGAWISPSFRVWDTHFHQSLKIHGTGELKNDKKGISIWVDAED